jgi:hypothetical protein
MDGMDNVEPDNRPERQLATALKSEPEAWTPECLEPDRILQLVDRVLPEAEAAPLMAHVALCGRCRREYAETVELAQLADEVRGLEASVNAVPAARPHAEPDASPPRQAVGAPEGRSLWQRWFSPGVDFALGAAAAGLILFGLTLPARTQRDNLAAALKARETETVRVALEKKALEDQIAALKREGAGDASRLAKQLESVNARLKSQGVQIARLEQDAATLQKMPLPAAEWMISPDSGQVRGTGGGQDRSLAIALLNPVNSAITDTTPTLEVKALSGATDYQISLEMADGNEEVPVPKAVSPTRWRVATPLRPGTVYQWAVTAQRGNARVRSPLVKFYVLSVAERRQIEEAKRQYAKNPLALGAIYARLGMLAEAEQQLREALQADPQQRVAKRWLQELRTRRRRASGE